MVPGAQLRNKPDEPSLWNSTIRLGEAFFNEIITQDLSGPGSTAVRFPETRGTPCARSLLRKRGRDARPCGLTGAAGWPRAPAHAWPGHATTGGYDGRRRPGGPHGEAARCRQSPLGIRRVPAGCQWRANGGREADAFPAPRAPTIAPPGARPRAEIRGEVRRPDHGESRAPITLAGASAVGESGHVGAGTGATD